MCCSSTSMGMKRVKEGEERKGEEKKEEKKRKHTKRRMKLNSSANDRRIPKETFSLLTLLLSLCFSAGEQSSRCFKVVRYGVVFFHRLSNGRNINRG